MTKQKTALDFLRDAEDALRKLRCIEEMRFATAAAGPIESEQPAFPAETGVTEDAREVSASEGVAYGGKRTIYHLWEHGKQGMGLREWYLDEACAHQKIDFMKQLRGPRKGKAPVLHDVICIALDCTDPPFIGRRVYHIPFEHAKTTVAYCKRLSDDT